MAIICHCEVVRDRDIVAAIQAGAASLDEVRNVCGAMSGCGACAPAVVDLLRRNGVAVSDTEAGSTALGCHAFATTGTA